MTKLQENLSECRRQLSHLQLLQQSFEYSVQPDGSILGEILWRQKPRRGFMLYQETTQQGPTTRDLYQYSLNQVEQKIQRQQTQWVQQQQPMPPPLTISSITNPHHNSSPVATSTVSSSVPHQDHRSTIYDVGSINSATSSSSAAEVPSFLSPARRQRNRHNAVYGHLPTVQNSPGLAQKVFGNRFDLSERQACQDLLNDEDDDLFANLDMDQLVTGETVTGKTMPARENNSSLPMNHTSWSNSFAAAPSSYDHVAPSSVEPTTMSYPFGGANPFGNSSSTALPPHGVDENTPICPGHGIPCVQRIAQTAANPGRPFYKCAHAQEPCDFFQWVDAQEGSWNPVDYDNNCNSVNSDVKDLDRENRRKFGHASFRPGQREIMENAVRGRDVFVLMPTGGGKSLCYQLPAWCCPGVTVVISPLLSLIQDQVHSLNKLGVEAVFLASSQDYHSEQVEIVRRLRDAQAHGGVKLVYITPEKLTNSGQIRGILQGLHRRRLLSRFVVDEAHCLSDWGHDFRPDYMRLNVLRQEYPGVPLMALTATANEKVVNDAIRNLGMQHEYRYKTSFNRPNLHYEVRKKDSKTLQEIAKYVAQRPGQSGVIYCLSRKDCERTAQELENLVREKPGCRHVRASFYHAELDATERERRHREWSNGAISVLCATIAFGMGIDKPDVRYVIHYSMPKSITHYYQESGRAGRDGEQADCILYYQYKDKKILENLIIQSASNPHAESTRRQVNQLYSCVQYCEDFSRCRRTMQLEFFGERFDRKKCGGTCDNCRAGREADRRDLTQVAQSMLKLYNEIAQQRQIGVTLNQLIDLYRGSKTKSATNYMNVKSLTQYGAGSSYSKPELERIAHALIFDHVLIERSEQTKSGFFTDYVHYGDKAHPILNGRERFYVEFPKSTSIATEKENKKKITKPAYSKVTSNPEPSHDAISVSVTKHDTRISTRLDDNRVESSNTKRQSDTDMDIILPKDKTKDLTDYIKRAVTEWADMERKAGNNMFYWNILPNAAMKSVAAMVPLSKEELKSVPGIGENIIEEYGDGIIDVCKAFVSENDAEEHVKEAKRCKRTKTKKHESLPDIISMLDDSDDEFGGDLDVTQVPDPVGSAKSPYF